MNLRIINGDSLTALEALPASSVQCCVTSPPYWGLRDYGVPATGWPEMEFRPMPGLPCVTVPAMTCCHGLEPDPLAFIAHEVAIFAGVWRALKADGTCWVNLGDSYASTGGAHGCRQDNQTGVGAKRAHLAGVGDKNSRRPPGGLKPKDLIGIPWRVAFALQAAGWHLRSDIIWHKPNPMPESVTDRPTKSHEYIFLLTKSERYLYAAAAIAERSGGFNGSSFTTGKTALNGSRKGLGLGERNEHSTRNKRTVWTVPSAPYAEAHFAAFPPDLIKPCILAGSRPGDTVLDPFGGSGTTGQVALELGRKAILVELSPEYCGLIRTRCDVTPGLNL